MLLQQRVLLLLQQRVLLHARLHEVKSYLRLSQSLDILLLLLLLLQQELLLVPRLLPNISSLLEEMLLLQQQDLRLLLKCAVGRYMSCSCQCCWCDD